MLRYSMKKSAFFIVAAFGLFSFVQGAFALGKKPLLPPAAASVEEAPPVGLAAYTKSHAKVQTPPDRLGGPLTVRVTQTKGSTRFVLPGPRVLDPAVFGTPGKPIGFDQAPFPLLGVPEDMRLSENGRYTITDHATPFSDWREVGVGSVRMTVVDATAIDGATTKDQIDFEADFSLPDGTPIRVVVKKPLPHGLAYPFFGGVVTNQLLHGATGIGSRLMPSEFVYAAFWGVGDIYRNGELVNQGHLVHVMLTEAVRGGGYRLLSEGEVGNPPTTRTLHLMIPPFKVVPGKGLVPDPLKTNFVPFPYVQKHMMKTMEQVKALPDGPEKRRKLVVLKQSKEVMGKTKAHVQKAMKEGKMFGQPFIHIMFGNLDISASGI